MRYIEICENDIRLMFGVDDHGRLLLFYVSTKQQDMDGITADLSEFSPVEVIVTGGNCPEDRLGHKLVHSSVGVGLTFLDHERLEEENGCRHVFYTQNEEYGLHVDLYYCFYDGIQAFTCFSRVINTGHIPQGLEAGRPFPCMGLMFMAGRTTRSAIDYIWYITAGRKSLHGALARFRRWGCPPRRKEGVITVRR